MFESVSNFDGSVYSILGALVLPVRSIWVLGGDFTAEVGFWGVGEDFTLGVHDGRGASFLRLTYETG